MNELGGWMGGCEQGPSSAVQPFQKYLLNRLTANTQFQNFLQSMQARVDEDMRHFFHKIMIHKWNEDGSALFTRLAKYYGITFFPVHYTREPHFCCFYTDSLTLIQKIIDSNFILPHQRHTFNVDVLFNDKTSTDLFGTRVTVEQLVSGVVSRRFSGECELDLTDFSNDRVLLDKRIDVHSLAQLAAYKRLMLRMGRDTKILNLTNNNLSQVPQEIMNFFLRGDLIGVNLSGNNIEALDKLPRTSSLLERLWLQDNPLCAAEGALSYLMSCRQIEALDKLPRTSSLLERLWLQDNPLCAAEGALSYLMSCRQIEALDKLPRTSSLLERLWLQDNPLCAAEDALSYVKRVTVLFPRLKELDGVPINRHGFSLPFVRNYLCDPAARSLTEKFLTLYFSHYDSSPRSDMQGFYHPTDCSLSISTSLEEEQLNDAKHFRTFSRNILSRDATADVTATASTAVRHKLYTRAQICQIFKQLPETRHDPSTFTVDVVLYEKGQLVVCVDGVFKERRAEEQERETAGGARRPGRPRLYQFRRTFYIGGVLGHHTIHNELLHVRAVTDPVILECAFTNQIRSLNELSLVSPAPELVRVVCTAFQHLTHLCHSEVERRLKVQNWDIRKALVTFQDELKNNRISSEMFVDPSLEDVSEDEVD